MLGPESSKGLISGEGNMLKSSHIEIVNVEIAMRLPYGK